MRKEIATFLLLVVLCTVVAVLNPRFPRSPICRTRRG